MGRESIEGTREEGKEFKRARKEEKRRTRKKVTPQLVLLS